MTDHSPARPDVDVLCDDCPPVGYETDRTRCLPCPRRVPPTSGEAAEGAGASKVVGIDGSGNPQGRSEPENIESTAAAPPKPAPDAMRFDAETIQTLLDLLNPLHGALDYQIHINSEGEHVYDAPPDYGHSVIVLAQQERDLTQAVLILEDRKRSAPVPSPDGTPTFDPTNHHNALKCPYCNPQGLSFSSPPDAGAAEPDYADGEAPWSEDEQFSEQAKACRSRRKQYGQDHCGEKDGTCTECEYDAQKVLRKKYPAAAAPPVRGDREAIAKLQEIVDLDSHGRYGRLAREAIGLLSLPAGERGSDAAEADRYFDLAGEFGNRIQRAVALIEDYDRHGSVDHSVAFEMKKILDPENSLSRQPPHSSDGGGR